MTEQITAKTLEKKGFSAEEIEKTTRVLERAEEKKTTAVRLIDKSVYWLALFLVIAGNFALSVILIPFLLISTGYYLIGILLIFGVSFGALFEVLICSIERLQQRHYIIAGLFIPAIAVINFFIMANLSNTLAVKMNLATGLHNPALVSIVYVGAFVLPYLLHKVKITRKRSVSFA